MRDGRIDAANVFGAQYYILEQLGFRKLVDTTFIIGFMVSESAAVEDLERYFRAMRRAQREIDLEPDRFKHYWRREMPDDVAEGIDVRRFGPGERIVFEPYTRDMFERTHRWMQRWELFDAARGRPAGLRGGRDRVARRRRRRATRPAAGAGTGGLRAARARRPRRGPRRRAGGRR